MKSTTDVIKLQKSNFVPKVGIILGSRLGAMEVIVACFFYC